MKKNRTKDALIISFFVVLFILILHKKNIINLSGGGSGSGESSSGKSSGKSSGENSGEEGSSEGTSEGSPGKPGKKSDHASRHLDNIFSSFEASVGMLDEEIQKAADEKYEREDPNKEIKPPSGVSRTSYYDENGKFKSSYDGEEVPADFLTKKEYFTDPAKMRKDINFKMDKMSWDMDNEKREFARTHDEYGKDREAFSKLLENHRKMKRKMYEENNETWRQLNEERYRYDSDLR